jgi:hypothetical protein
VTARKMTTMSPKLRRPPGKYPRQTKAQYPCRGDVHYVSPLMFIALLIVPWWSPPIR